MKKYNIVILTLLTALLSCRNDEKNAGADSSPVQHKTEKQLNISILWDLSDRINPARHKASPSHAERDIAILKYCADYFKADMEKKGAHLSKGKLKVFFSPNPTDENINAMASTLSIDLSTKDVKEKKQIHDHISGNFRQTGQKIADVSMRTSAWQGADLYRFFKNDVDRCIEKDTNYRNILVILTDGYVYDKNSMGRSGNRSEYISPSLLRSLGLRDRPDYESVFKAKNCGLIPRRDDLGQLEILVLEVNPEEHHENDEDIIKLYLQQWFTEMKVGYFEIHNTDLPENIEKRIKDFMIRTK